MTRHAGDLLSLVGGLVVLGTGLVLLAGGVGDVPMAWVGPTVAIGIGLLIVVAARPGRDADEDPAPPPDAA